VTLQTCTEGVAWLRANDPPALAIIDVELREGQCDDVANILVEGKMAHIVHSGLMRAEAPLDAGIWLPKPSTTQDLIDAIRSVTAIDGA
jgi:hypothetical protein